MSRFVFIGAPFLIVFCSACDNAGPRAQLIFELFESEATARWVEVEVRTLEGDVLFYELRANDLGAQDYPLVRSEASVTEFVVFTAAIYERPEPPTAADEPLARIEATAQFQEGKVLNIPLRITETCAAGKLCAPGQTCYRGSCRGSCFVAVEGTQNEDLAPECGPCETCQSGRCEAVADLEPCDCVGSECREGECSGPELESVSAGTGSTCVVRAGDLFCWGSVPNGIDGVNRSGDPTLVFSGARSVVSGGVTGDALVAHRCLLDANNQAACWGDNSSGQLGTGTTVSAETPTPVRGELRFEELALGGRHSCGRTLGGDIWCWGENEEGQLGLSDQGLDESEPVQIMLPGSSPATAICAGPSYSCAVFNDGQVRCWGAGPVVEVSADNDLFRLIPLSERAVEIACGSVHACARNENGGVSCWGTNRAFQLGVTDLEAIGPNIVGGVSNTVELSCSHNHCCVLDASGAMRCWGQGSNRQLGGGSMPENSARPISPWARIGSWSGVSAGRAHSCATAGTELYCWGDDGRKVLGFDAGSTLTPGLVCLPP